MEPWAPYQQQIISSPLFLGLNWNDDLQILSCARARLKRFGKKETVLARGATGDSIYIILDGQVKTVYVTGSSADNMTDKLSPPKGFGYIHSLLKSPNLMDYITMRDTVLLEFSSEVLFHACASSCPAHGKVVENLMVALSHDVVALSCKIYYMHIRGLRKRLVTFLLDQSAGHQSFECTINRTEMAEYLGLSRASMTRELGLLQQEGLLQASRNRFVILNEPALRTILSTE